MSSPKVKQLLFVFIIVLVPIAVNYLCLTSVPSEVVSDPVSGSSPLWVNFFGCYFGGVVTAFCSMYIFYRTLLKDQYKKEYEHESQYYTAFCRDLSRLVTTLNIDRLAYIFLAMREADSHELIQLIKEVKDFEMKMKEEYNSFMLIYGDRKCVEKDSFAEQYIMNFNMISSELDRIFEALSNENKVILQCTIGEVVRNLKEMGDITKPLCRIAEKWKHAIYEQKEDARTKYEQAEI